jgi:hypothetical protein
MEYFAHSLNPVLPFIIDFKETLMKHALVLSIGAFTLAFASMAGADATFTYELTEADGKKTVKTFSTARLYVRIDDAADEKRYLLFEAGKFFPLYAVDQAKSTYAQLTQDVIPYMGPETEAKKKADAHESKVEPVEKAPRPVFKPTSKKKTVAGVRCRIVHEMAGDKPAIEHCMADSAKLNITDREVITMTRTFSMARDHKFGWLAVGTEDEEFISVQSRDLNDNRVFKLTSVDNKPLKQGYLRIPREYKKVEAGKQAAATK